MALALIAVAVIAVRPPSVDAGPRDFVIGAPGTDQCLDVPGNSRRIGQDLTTYACHGGNSQRFVNRGDDIQHVSSGLCLGYENRVQRSGDVELRPCGESGPWFRFEDAGGDLLRIKAIHANPDKCLDRAGSGSANGTKVVFWNCHGGSNQTWRMMADFGFTITAAGSNKCFDVNPARVGTDVVLWDCHGGGTQLFAERGSEIVHVESGHCVGYQNATSGRGRRLELRSCGEAGPDFEWRVAEEGWTIRSRHTNPDLCVDREGGRSDIRTPVIYWTCHGGINQQWTRVVYEHRPGASYVTHHGEVYTSPTSRHIDQGVEMEWWVRVRAAEANDATACNGRGFGNCVYFPMMMINLDAPGSGTHVGPQLANNGSDQFDDRWIINYGIFGFGSPQKKQWTGAVAEGSWIRFRFNRVGTTQRGAEWLSQWEVRAQMNGVDRLLDTVEMKGRWITSVGLAYESLEFGGDPCVTSAPDIEYRVDRYRVETGTNSTAWRDFYGVKAHYSGTTKDVVCPRDEFRRVNNGTGHLRVVRYDRDATPAIANGDWIVARP